MTVRRVVGLETEYGVAAPSDPTLNPMLLSSQVVNAYAAPLGHRAGRARWDYEDEQPLRDARGWEIRREEASADLRTDDDPDLVNVILSNGGRLYVDHAHPEYSGPEVTTPRAAVRWDRAGDAVMLQAARAIAATPGLAPVNLYKNNTDGKGASYGTHENYLVQRRIPFTELVRHLTPFFVSRQILASAGRLGWGQGSQEAGFQISQRADFFEVEVGLETTLKRPIINTRDEPHADAARWRRLHVIVGDATQSDVATLLKVGTTSLVLHLIETGGLDAGPAADLTLADPVAALHTISRDPTLTVTVPLRDGRMLSALDLQEAYLQQVRDAGADAADDPGDTDTVEVVQRWQDVLDRLRRDPALCAAEIDWVAKLQLLQGFRDRDGLDWDSDRLRLIDLQFSDVRPEKGLHARLAQRGRIERLITDEEVAAAVATPPEDTRAYFRGRCIDRYGEHVAAASWDSVIFDVPGHGALQRVPMLEPLRGTREHVGDLLDRCPDAATLLAALAAG